MFPERRPHLQLAGCAEGGALDETSVILKKGSRELSVSSMAPHLQLAGRAEGGALVDLRLEHLVDFVVGGAHDRGAPAADVVNVLVAVHVKAVRPLREQVGSGSLQLCELARPASRQSRRTACQRL